MPRRASVVTVFLASPGDLVEERDVVSKMVSSMNHEHALKGDDVVIQLKRWETLPPGASRGAGQGVINERADIANVDIFLGLMWKRAGTPTAVAESGTIEEYNIAFEAWNAKQSPQIALYFRKSADSQNEAIEEREQREVVERFRARVGGQVLYQQLPTELAEMERTLRTDLALMVGNAVRDVPTVTRSERVFGSGTQPLLVFSGEFQLHPSVAASIQHDSQLDERSKERFRRAPLGKSRTGDEFSFSASGLIAMAEAKATSYLARAFAAAVPAPRELQIATDGYQAENDEIDFVAFGAYSNDRSFQVAVDSANRLVVPAAFKSSGGPWESRFIARGTGRPIHGPRVGDDYALIMRIAPASQQSRTWIFCGGLGERGTAGGAYFLANRWRELADRVPAGCRHFAALVQIEATSDQRSKLIGVYTQPEELPSFGIPSNVRVKRWDC